MTKDGTAITDFFDDNVQMKDFHWYINGVKNVWVNLETHPFRVGTTIVTVRASAYFPFWKGWHYR